MKTQDPKYDIEDGRLVNAATRIPIPEDEPILFFGRRIGMQHMSCSYTGGYAGIISTKRRCTHVFVKCKRLPNITQNGCKSRIRTRKQ